jgi:hypothetical protein
MPNSAGINHFPRAAQNIMDGTFIAFVLLLSNALSRDQPEFFFVSLPAAP